jgi:hypothetical protein
MSSLSVFQIFCWKEAESFKSATNAMEETIMVNRRPDGLTPSHPGPSPLSIHYSSIKLVSSAEHVKLDTIWLLVEPNIGSISGVASLRKNRKCMLYSIALDKNLRVCAFRPKITVSEFVARRGKAFLDFTHPCLLRPLPTTDPGKVFLFPNALFPNA